ncbi:hypothetical protein SELMODRAFT_102694 [Selaginella moellendorffii]|uniref:Uncharacterized protein n=2 Tax=Selaginella moellendorffii TaxID=88036 RepID=D8RVQ8_SELML|nr:hypothetical protein SELMODRAFT_102694 [Selaginella moellendorffii]
MQSVTFANGAPMFSKYLDTFPFPYYVILKDIEALPRTLADLLRQVRLFVRQIYSLTLGIDSGSS